MVPIARFGDNRVTKACNPSADAQDPIGHSMSFGVKYRLKGPDTADEGEGRLSPSVGTWAIYRDSPMSWMQSAGLD